MKPGGGGPALFTVKSSEVIAVREPLVPVIVTVADPRLAVLLAVSDKTLVSVVGFGLKDAVTPLGNPEATKALADVMVIDHLEKPSAN